MVLTTYRCSVVDIDKNKKYFIGFRCFASYWDSSQAILTTARVKKIVLIP